MSSHGRQPTIKLPASQPHKSTREAPAPPGSHRTTPEPGRTSRDVTPQVLRPSDQEQQILGRLEQIVDEFRHGRKSKVDAVTEIVETINKSDLDEKFRRGSIADYITVLTDIESKEKERDERTEHHEETENRQPGERDGSVNREQLVEPDEEGERRKGKERARSPTFPPIHAHRNRLLRAAPESSDASSNSEADTSEGKSSPDQPKTKKRKVKEEDLPWYHGEKLARETEDPRCVENRRLLKLYHKDPSRVKQHIAASRTAPCNFPTSEWDKLLRGELADFDVIYSAIHHVGTPQENRGRIGDREIVFGHSDPVRKVENHGQWTIAASLYEEAISFAWPSRREEWANHYRYIVGLFSAKPTALHACVIEYEKAVRARVGPGTKMLLTDRNRFDDLRDAI